MRSCLQKSKPHAQKTGRPGFGISAPEPGGSRSPNLIPHPKPPNTPTLMALAGFVLRWK